MLDDADAMASDRYCCEEKHIHKRKLVNAMLTGCHCWLCPVSHVTICSEPATMLDDGLGSSWTAERDMWEVDMNEPLGKHETRCNCNSLAECVCVCIWVAQCKWLRRRQFSNFADDVCWLRSKADNEFSAEQRWKNIWHQHLTSSFDIFIRHLHLTLQSSCSLCFNPWLQNQSPFKNLSYKHCAPIWD